MQTAFVRHCFGLIISFMAVACFAQTTPPLVSSTSFEGYLGYLDYQSSKEVQIPLEITINQSADMNHLIVDRTFTDPGFKVYALSVIKIDLASNTLTETTFDGEGSSVEAFTLSDFQYETQDDWLIVRKAERQDDNRDAILTIREQMKNGEFTSESRVDYLDTPDNENLRRNWTVTSATD